MCFHRLLFMFCQAELLRFYEPWLLYALLSLASGFVLFCFLLQCWGFELRASHLLGRRFTTWATPPASLVFGRRPLDHWNCLGLTFCHLISLWPEPIPGGGSISKHQQHWFESEHALRCPVLDQAETGPLPEMSPLLVFFPDSVLLQSLLDQFALSHFNKHPGVWLWESNLQYLSNLKSL
jgi:hypothetical protein